MWHEYGEMVAKETSHSRRKRAPRPLDRVSLNDLALSYVARFATSGAKLESYLKRKIRERGVAEGSEPLDPEAIVARLVELRYIDDEAYATSKAGSLLRRGYGARRVEEALRAAGIADGVRHDVAPGESELRRSAMLLAQKRRFGPYGPLPDPDADSMALRKLREKQIAAMVRAGHGFDTARKVVEAAHEEELEEWLIDAQEDAGTQDRGW